MKCIYCGLTELQNTGEIKCQICKTATDARPMTTNELIGVIRRLEFALAASQADLKKWREVTHKTYPETTKILYENIDLKAEVERLKAGIPRAEEMTEKLLIEIETLRADRDLAMKIGHEVGEELEKLRVENDSLRIYALDVEVIAIKNTKRR